MAASTLSPEQAMELKKPTDGARQPSGDHTGSSSPFQLVHPMFQSHDVSYETSPFPPGRRQRCRRRLVKKVLFFLSPSPRRWWMIQLIRLFAFLFFFPLSPSSSGRTKTDSSPRNMSPTPQVSCAPLARTRTVSTFSSLKSKTTTLARASFM